MSKNNYSRAVRERAEKIPGQLVATHPDVAQARAALEEAETLSDALNQKRRDAVASAKRLEARIEGLNAEIDRRRGALPGVALAAFEAGDEAVRAAVDERAQIQRLVWQVDACTDALRGFRAARIDGASASAAESAGSSVNAASANLQQTIERVVLELAYAADNNHRALAGDWPGVDEAYAFARGA